MASNDVDIDEETLKRIQDRVLREESSQLHYKSPPSIIQDLKQIVEEEITDIDVED